MVLVAVALVACGSGARSATGPGGRGAAAASADPSQFIDNALSSRDAAAQSAAAVSRSSSAATTAATSASTHSTTPSVPAGAPASATPTFQQYAPGTTPAAVSASLSRSCVTPGNSQTLTIRAEPDFQISFDAQYSDGKEGSTYGGRGLGKTNSDGEFTSTWVVAPTAPAGQVIVWIAASKDKETAFRQPTFVVASSC